MNPEQQLIVKLIDEVNFLRSDKDMLDWLSAGNRYPEHYEGEWHTENGSYATLREALKEQMEKNK